MESIELIWTIVGGPAVKKDEKGGCRGVEVEVGGSDGQ